MVGRQDSICYVKNGAYLRPNQALVDRHYLECNQALVGMQVTAGYISVDSFLHGTVEKLARRGGDFLVLDVKPFLFF